MSSACQASMASGTLGGVLEARKAGPAWPRYSKSHWLKGNRRLVLLDQAWRTPASHWSPEKSIPGDFRRRARGTGCCCLECPWKGLAQPTCFPTSVCGVLAPQPQPLYVVNLAFAHGTRRLPEGSLHSSSCPCSGTHPMALATSCQLALRTSARNPTQHVEEQQVL